MFNELSNQFIVVHGFYTARMDLVWIVAEPLNTAQLRPSVFLRPEGCCRIVPNHSTSTFTVQEHKANACIRGIMGCYSEVCGAQRRRTQCAVNASYTAIRRAQNLGGELVVGCEAIFPYFCFASGLHARSGVRWLLYER